MNLFFLRILLTIKPGATSFEDLRTLKDSTVSETYKRIRKFLKIINYIRNTDEFDRAMGEADLKCHPRK